MHLPYFDRRSVSWTRTSRPAICERRGRRLKRFDHANEAFAEVTEVEVAVLVDREARGTVQRRRQRAIARAVLAALAGKARHSLRLDVDPANHTGGELVVRNER